MAGLTNSQRTALLMSEPHKLTLGETAKITLAAIEQLQRI
jgi:hypothetical protein